MRIPNVLSLPRPNINEMRGCGVLACLDQQKTGKGVTKEDLTARN